MQELADGVNAFQKGQYSEAYSLLLPFAEQGELRAQLILARLFYAGHGVERSEERYLYWLRRSADSGDKAAKSLIKRLERGDIQPPFELGARHIDAYRLFGYLHIPRFYMSDITSLSSRFDTTASEFAEQGRAAGSPDIPWLDDVARQGRLVDIVNRLLGYLFEQLACETFGITGAGGFQYGSSLDNQAKRQGLRAIACLDRGGAMQLFPGSHKPRDAFARELRAAVDAAQERSDSAGRAALLETDSCASELFLQPGDLLLCDLNLVHRLQSRGRELRVIGMEYTAPRSLRRRLGDRFSRRIGRENGK